MAIDNTSTLYLSFIIVAFGP